MYAQPLHSIHGCQTPVNQAEDISDARAGIWLGRVPAYHKSRVPYRCGPTTGGRHTERRPRVLKSVTLNTPPTKAQSNIPAE
jgi:hypothetical protein